MGTLMGLVVVEGVQPKSFHDQREEKQLVIPNDMLQKCKYRNRVAKSKFRKLISNRRLGNAPHENVYRTATVQKYSGTDLR